MYSNETIYSLAMDTLKSIKRHQHFYTDSVKKKAIYDLDKLFNSPLQPSEEDIISAFLKSEVLVLEKSFFKNVAKQSTFCKKINQFIDRAQEFHSNQSYLKPTLVSLILCYAKVDDPKMRMYAEPFFNRLLETPEFAPGIKMPNQKGLMANFADIGAAFNTFYQAFQKLERQGTVHHRFLHFAHKTQPPRFLFPLHNSSSASTELCCKFEDLNLALGTHFVMSMYLISANYMTKERGNAFFASMCQQFKKESLALGVTEQEADKYINYVFEYVEQNEGQLLDQKMVTTRLCAYLT